MATYGIIPARMASSRLPGKMLLAETGKPLIWYAWNVARQSLQLDDVIIATDSPEIADVCRAFGARVEMTGEHVCGTDRISEVVQKSLPDADTVVNIQGDEPELDPEVINVVVQTLHNHPNVEMATAATPIQSLATLNDRACVKVVRSADGRALYFSRLPVPFSRDVPAEVLFGGEGEAAGYSESPWLLHLGIYAYRRNFLVAFSQMPASRLERLESLEQLRALECGASIQVAVVRHRSLGIDTAEDYARFVERQKKVGSG
jgi:3-deoxy-manno-octulosonate cytidylyltransferase (CMP-KDO synthetase)